MIALRSFPVLVVLTLLTSGSDGLMLQSTCTTIKDQLQRIDRTITTTAQYYTSEPFYEGYSVDERLRMLLQDFANANTRYDQRLDRLTAFVKRKLKQFSIATQGFEESTTLLDEVFLHVEKRNAFNRLQVKEQQEVNENSSKENGELTVRVAMLEQQKHQLEQRLAKFTETLSNVERETRKLQAKLKDNPVHVQG